MAVIRKTTPYRHFNSTSHRQRSHPMAMNSVFTFALLLCYLVGVGTHGQQVSKWTWLSGRNKTNITSNNAHIASRSHSRLVRHPLNSSLLVTFGGWVEFQKSSANMWTFDYAQPPANQFKWIDGPNATGTSGISTRPDARILHCTVPINSSLYIFGGEIPTYIEGFYFGGGLKNDMWEFDFTTTTWRFLAGTNKTKGAAYKVNTPGARQGHVCWYTPTTPDLFYVFGGAACPNSSSTIGFMNDLWSYNFATGLWTFIGGSNATNVDGMATGIAMPGTRMRPIFFTLPALPSKLFIGGGFGKSLTSASSGNLNDFWEYDVLTGKWTFLLGSDNTYQTEVYTGVAQSPGGFLCASASELNDQTVIIGGISTLSGATNQIYLYNGPTNALFLISGSTTLRNAAASNGGKMPFGRRDALVGLAGPVNGTTLRVLLGGGWGSDGIAEGTLSDYWMTEVQLCSSGSTPSWETMTCSCPVNSYSRALTCLSCPTNATTNGQMYGISAASCGCPAGFISPNPGTTACTPCPADTFRAEWSNQSFLVCTSCDINTTTNGSTAGNSSSACICKPGYFGNGSGTCQQCPVDTYKSSPGNTVSCTSCDGNTTTNGATGAITLSACICKSGFYRNGMGSCEKCPINTFKTLVGNAASCTSCGANTTTNGSIGATSSSDCICSAGYYGDGVGTCYACPAGTFKSNAGNSNATVCTACPVGQFSLEGSTLCTNVCAPGSYLLNDACTVCPVDTYKSSFGNLTACTACPGNTSTWGGLASHHDESSDCGCPAGYQLDSLNTSCVLCLAGTYNSAWGTSACAVCATGATTIETGANACVCDIGYYGDGLSGACTACPAGTAKLTIGDAGSCALTSTSTASPSATSSSFDSAPTSTSPSYDYDSMPTSNAPVYDYDTMPTLISDSSQSSSTSAVDPVSAVSDDKSKTGSSKSIIPGLDNVYFIFGVLIIVVAAVAILGFVVYFKYRRPATRDDQQQALSAAFSGSIGGNSPGLITGKTSIPALTTPGSTTASPVGGYPFSSFSSWQTSSPGHSLATYKGVLPVYKTATAAGPGGSMTPTLASRTNVWSNGFTTANF